MKKPKSIAPYLFGAIITVFVLVTHNLFTQNFALLRAGIFFVFFVGLWHLIEWLLNRAKYVLLQSLYVLISVGVYAVVYAYFNNYVLSLLGLKPEFTTIDWLKNLFLLTVMVVILILGIRWTKAREQAQIENLTLQSEHIEAQFELLREQVNPQFLFHCLKTLQTMVRTDDAQTEAYILKLANVYRQTLKKERNLVRLEDELSLLQTYMFLMRYGRESAITLTIEIADESLQYQIPIFALQMLGDNYIKHSTFSESAPLDIHIFQQEAHSITIAYNYTFNTGTAPFNMDIAYLEMRYIMEGIENGVVIRTENATYSTTLQLI